jgi:hypothetical protein
MGCALPFHDTRETILIQDRSAILSATPGEFVCADCETVEMSLDRQLPEGWDKFEHGGRTVVRCPDCNEAIEREHQVAEATHAPAAADAQRIWPTELSATLAQILGLDMAGVGPAASTYRAAGFEIPSEPHSERAFVLHRWIALWIEHGDAWREAATLDVHAANTVANQKDQRNG